MNRLFIHLPLLLILSSCGDAVDNRLMVKNSSNKPVAVEFSNDTIPVAINKADYYLATALQPKESRQFSQPGSNNAWALYMQMGNNKKLSVYFYDIDTIKKYSDMDYINKNKLFVNKIEISEEELNKDRWIINYP